MQEIVSQLGIITTFSRGVNVSIRHIFRRCCELLVNGNQKRDCCTIHVDEGQVQCIGEHLLGVTLYFNFFDYEIRAHKELYS